MKQIKATFLPLIFLTSFSLPAQNSGILSKDFWHEGELITANGEAVKGKIQYSFEENRVLLKKNNATIQSFKSFQTQLFSFKDELSKKHRVFYPVKVNRNEFREDVVFFELIAEGINTLLSREKLVFKPYPNSGQHKWTKPGYYEPIDEFYVLNSAGQLQKFKNTQNLAYHLDISPSKLHSIIQNQQLNLSLRQDFSKLLKVCNDLTESEPIERETTPPSLGGK
jgi:hypothetical protein